VLYILNLADELGLLVPGSWLQDPLLLAGCPTFLASFKANKRRLCVCSLNLAKWSKVDFCNGSPLMRTRAASWLIVVCSLFAIHLYLLCDLFIQKHNNFPNLFFLYIYCCVYLFIWLLAKLRVWSFVPSSISMGSARDPFYRAIHAPSGIISLVFHSWLASFSILGWAEVECKSLLPFDVIIIRWVNIPEWGGI